jgi:hypothetical protein
VKHVYHIFLLIVGIFSFYAENIGADPRPIKLSATKQELLIAKSRFEAQETRRLEGYAAVLHIAPQCDIVALCCTENNNYWRARRKISSTEMSHPRIRTAAYRNATIASETYTKRLYAVLAQQRKNLSLISQKPLGCSIL